jgi:hypothetical protein
MYRWIFRHTEATNSFSKTSLGWCHSHIQYRLMWMEIQILFFSYSIYWRQPEHISSHSGYILNSYSEAKKAQLQDCYSLLPVIQTETTVKSRGLKPPQEARALFSILRLRNLLPTHFQQERDWESRATSSCLLWIIMHCKNHYVHY